MKKVSLLVAMIAFVCGNAFAQSYDFDQYNVGDKVAQTIGAPWNTWSNAPGTAEDAVFSNDFAASGANSVKFTYGVDQIFDFGGQTTGAYSIDFNMYVPTGKDAYLNIQHNFTGDSNGEWAFEVYFNSSDNGTVLKVSSEDHSFTFPFDQWFPVHFDVNMDNDAISMSINDVTVHSWAFSEQANSATPGLRVLDVMDFFPPSNSSTSLFYIDDFSFESNSGEEVVLFESFEDYEVGGKVAQQAVAMGRDYWTTWSNNPGSAEDPVVSDAYASDGDNSMYIGSTSNDAVLLFGEQQTGVFDVTMDLYIEEGKSGYFNLLHEFAGTNSNWALQAYFHLHSTGQGNPTSTPGQGILFAGVPAADAPVFTCYYDEWMHIRVHVDADNDVAEFYVNDELIHTWQWSKNSFGEEGSSSRVLDAMDVFAASSNSFFYIDNIQLVKIGGASAPDMAVTPGSFNEYVPEDELVVKTITISNDGNSIGDWSGYVDYGQGQGGSSQQEMTYDNGNPTNLTGLQTANMMEIASKFPVTAYGGAALGTKLTKVKYFVAEDSNNVLGFSGDLTMRAYKAGANGVPGELLGEVVIPENQIVRNDWNTATFAEEIWLTGYDVFVTAEFQQIDNGYPVCFDDGQMVPGVRYLRIGGTSSNTWYLIDDIWSTSYNFCLRAVCQGTPLTGGNWASLSKNQGSLLGGSEEEITLTLSTIGMSDGDVYNATLLIETNDSQNPLFEIPITLNVSSDAVAENSDVYSIYPNPAASMVTLEGENLNVVAIYNVAGQLIRIVKLENVVNSIEMNVEAGVYFFNIYDNSGNSTVQRVVITK